MKYTFFLLFITSLAFANKNTFSPKQVQENAKLNYLEIHPNQKMEIEVQAIKCSTAHNELHLERLNSSKKVKGGVVNAVTVFIRAGKCKDSAFSSVWSDKIVIKKVDKWTHLYIVSLSENVMILKI